MLERAYSGQEKPIKKILPELFPELTYSEICACLRRKDVKADGKRVTGEERISRGVISIYPRAQKTLKVLYEDEHLLAVYKPKGIASEGAGSFESLVKKEKGESCVLMHRLDTNTDGVLLFAKDSASEKELFRAMKEGLIEKTYSAEVYGFPPIRGEIELNYYYKKNEAEGRAMISDLPKEGYIPVSIFVSVEKRREESSIVKVRLHKGKMHQIRAMLAFYGYFILGDGKYGDDRINKALGIKKHRLTATSVSFSFPENSVLFYLNRITIRI